MLSVLAVVWLYPVMWTLVNAIRPSADIYRAAWDRWNGSPLTEFSYEPTGWIIKTAQRAQLGT